MATKQSATGAVAQIRPNMVPSWLRMLHEINVTGFLWGGPGSAKSALIKQYAQQKGLPLYIVHLSQMDTVDLKGIPALVECSYDHYAPDGTKTTEKSHATAFFGPNFLPRKEAVLFFDEVNQALPAVLAAAQRIVLDGENEGGWRKHPKTLIVCAGNRVQDRTNVCVLPSAFDNRLVHAEMSITAADTDTLTTYLTETHGDDEAGIEALSYVVPYLGFKPDAAYKFDPNGPRDGVHGQPTWRTWEMLLREARTFFAAGLKLSDPLFATLALGTIGTSVGTEFMSFTRVREQLAKSDPKLLLAGDKSWQPPKEVDVAWAFAGALAPLVNKKTYKRALEGVDAMRTGGRKDLTIVALRLIIKAYGDIVATPEFISMASQYANVVGFGNRRAARSSR